MYNPVFNCTSYFWSQLIVSATVQQFSLDTRCCKFGLLISVYNFTRAVSTSWIKKKTWPYIFIILWWTAWIIIRLFSNVYKYNPFIKGQILKLIFFVFFYLFVRHSRGKNPIPFYFGECGSNTGSLNIVISCYMKVKGFITTRLMETPRIKPLCSSCLLQTVWFLPKSKLESSVNELKCTM